MRKKSAIFQPPTYPTGVIFQGGLNLHEVTADRSHYIAPLQPLQAVTSSIIVIPTSTNARTNRRNIEHVFNLAAMRDDSLVLFLCSGKAKKEDIAAIAYGHSVQWAAIENSFSSFSRTTLRTSMSPFAYGAEKDTSQKRNFALRLAQVMGWPTIFFMDDDIQLSREQFDKAMVLMKEGDDISIVGFNARDFPDLSVINHAHRWANGPIDSFIGTGALLIKINPHIGFFPHSYNEDWFFLLDNFLSKRGRIIWAGSIKQDVYDPFKLRKRAIQEEPGDILGEGIMRLVINSNLEGKPSRPTITSIVAKADETFWEHEIDHRIQFIQNAIQAIKGKRMPSIQKYSALAALDASIRLLVQKNTSITAKNLSEWTRAWGKDLRLWRQQAPAGPHPTNLVDGLRLMNIHDNFIYSNSKPPETRSAVVKHASIFQRTPVDDTVASVNISASKKTLRAIEYTVVTQRYLAANGWPLSRIVNATDRLRRDRPVFDKPNNFPALTILVLIQNHEQPANVSSFIKNVIRKNFYNHPIEVILAVHADDTRSVHTAMYRNELVAHIIHEISGTNIRLRSTIIRARKATIDTAIQSLLGMMVFAYWKANISITQPVLVTNSHGHLMRTGTLRELMQKQHSVTWETFDTYLAKLLHSVERTNHVLSPDDDAAAKQQARHNLYSEPQRKKNRFKVYIITQRMVAAMKIAGLTWSQTDALAHKVKFHHDKERKDAPLYGIVKSKCITIPVTPKTLANYNAQANLILTLISNPRVNYCLVISAPESVSWRRLETYRTRLAAAVMSGLPVAPISSLTYRYRAEEQGIVFKNRVVAVMRYTHWLHQHNQVASITWMRPLRILKVRLLKNQPALLLESFRRLANLKNGRFNLRKIQSQAKNFQRIK